MGHIAKPRCEEKIPRTGGDHRRCRKKAGQWTLWCREHQILRHPDGTSRADTANRTGAPTTKPNTRHRGGWGKTRELAAINPDPIAGVLSYGGEGTLVRTGRGGRVALDGRRYRVV